MTVSDSYTYHMQTVPHACSILTNINFGTGLLQLYSCYIQYNIGGDDSQNCRRYLGTIFVSTFEIFKLQVEKIA